ncbi:transferase hexapeptide domain protein [Talaromyces proteolyticus]|uniref:Dynactin subunit 6 n=1 Tax=Talaromyces proteolyticus TaxID=1131652 RepID=A0AAD4KWK1_9EURO|nr:transferase hexapeptide domain protein [Talaromyces proteolyticus]KAH8701656.1 transferase hexapeptide domain protein [Talaromyces proteolyticus]
MSSSASLKPPPAGLPRQRVVSPSTGTPGPPPPPRAPVSVHSTTTVSETATFHGTYPITIGSGTVIHPRARLYSFEGPIHIGDGCVIGEKCAIGDNEPTAQPASDAEGITTRLSSSVTIGPQTTIRTGAYIRSAAAVDALAVVNRNAIVGSHSKVCSRCEVPEKSTVEDWTVVWAAGQGIGQRKRRRLVGPAAVVSEKDQRPNAKRVEDARLVVLHKEREGLAKMISLSASGGKRR